LSQVDAIDASLTQLIEEHRVAVVDFVHCAGMLAIRPLRLSEHVHGAGDHECELHVRGGNSPVVDTAEAQRQAPSSRGVHLEHGESIRRPWIGLYCASKGALDAFMRAMAVELAPDVRSNSVLPGTVKTAMTKAMLEDPDFAGAYEGRVSARSGRAGKT